jgi:hypothetical protein
MKCQCAGSEANREKPDSAERGLHAGDEIWLPLAARENANSWMLLLHVRHQDYAGTWASLVLQQGLTAAPDLVACLRQQGPQRQRNHIAIAGLCIEELARHPRPQQGQATLHARQCCDGELAAVLAVPAQRGESQSSAGGGLAGIALSALPPVTLVILLRDELRLSSLLHSAREDFEPQG